jgi:uncharacterized protein (TIGR00725 family)
MIKKLGPRIAVIGAAQCPPEEAKVAEEVGLLLARTGAVLVCGGRGGVMEAACRGARRAGGLTVGILPGEDPAQANEWVLLPLATGLGEARNVLVVRCAQAVIAIGGGYGTLSEIALALKFGRPVIGIDTWRAVDNEDELASLIPAHQPAHAVALALEGILAQEDDSAPSQPT